MVEPERLTGVASITVLRAVRFFSMAIGFGI